MVVQAAICKFGCVCVRLQEDMSVGTDIILSCEWVDVAGIHIIYGKNLVMIG